MAIVLRLSKGDTLTYAELDGNFSDLDTRVISLEANKTNWDQAYTWGNHAAQGYLTFYTETDPVFVASAAYDITTQNINNWSTAYNWGDHSSVGYLTSINTESIGNLSDVDLSNSPNIGNTLQWNGTAWVPSQSSGSETDPVFGTSPAATIDNTMISNWNDAYSWGDHSSVGYLGSSHPTANIVASNITNWNDAYSWGDHSLAGYLTSLGSIANHSDVSLSGVTDGFTLVWQTDKFVPQAVSGGTNVSIADTSPTNAVNGDMWWDSSDGVLKIYYNDGTSLQWVDAVPQGGGAGTSYTNSDVDSHLNQAGPTDGYVLSWSSGDYAWVAPSGLSIPWTRFYFDRGGVTPTTVANSENVGKNFGSWTETTSSNNGTSGITPSSAIYDPTLSGVTVNANGEFEFPAGVYEVHASIQFKIYNTTGNLQKYDFYLYAESGTNWAGSYDEQLLVPDTSTLVDNNMMIKISGLYVFENATQTNNILYLQMGSTTSPVNANMFPDYGYLDIKKIG